MKTSKVLSTLPPKPARSQVGNRNIKIQVEEVQSVQPKMEAVPNSNPFKTSKVPLKQYLSLKSIRKITPSTSDLASNQSHSTQSSTRPQSTNRLDLHRVGSTTSKPQPDYTFAVFQHLNKPSLQKNNSSKYQSNPLASIPL